MYDAGPGNAQLRARHGGEPDQRADLDVIGPDRIIDGAERGRPMHDHGVGADAVDTGAERDQEMRKVLHMRFGGDVAQIRGAVGGNRRHQRILGRGDAGLIEKDVRALQARAAQFQSRRCRNRGAELLEGEEMRIEPAPADHVAARRRQHHLTAACQQWSRKQDRRADPRTEFRIEIGGANAFGMNGERIGLQPFG